jgi:VWFA-related protein
MCYKKTHGLVLLILTGICLFLISPSTFLAQSTRSEKPKIKDFGSSLKKFEKKAKDNSSSNVQESKVTDEETIRVKTDLVVSEVLVIDRKGNAILNLKESDFVISENGAEQKTEVFTVSEKATIPRSIVLIIDYSGSQLPYIKNSIEAAKVLVDKLPPQDRMAIVTDDVELLVHFTKNKELLKKKLNSLNKRVLAHELGKSEQYSALLVVLNEMFDEEDLRPIVVLQSDGDEFFALKRTQPAKQGESLPQLDGSTIFGIAPKNYSYEDVYSVVSKSRATIYSIVPGLRLIGHSLEGRLEKTMVMNDRQLEIFYQMLGRKRVIDTPKQELINMSNWYLKQQLSLLDIAKLSGGYLEFLEKPEDAEKVYSNIFAAMNNRYLIGYYPTNLVQDGKRRDVKIEVKGHPDYIVVGRKTYFAPEH